MADKITPGAWTDLSAEAVVRLLDLAPHPEGGFYRETYRDPVAGPDGRSVSTAIYFLLPFGTVSAWHRIDAAEVWHFYAGLPLRLAIAMPDGRSYACRLGPNLPAGEYPQCVVPAGAWQMAEAVPPEQSVQSLALPAWSLVGCTVAPGFVFSSFELAPPGWKASSTYTSS